MKYSAAFIIVFIFFIFYNRINNKTNDYKKFIDSKSFNLNTSYFKSEYDSLINLAELSIIEKNYISANRNYSNAFKCDSSRIKSKDLYNAFILTLKRDSFMEAINLMRKLVLRGYEPDLQSEEIYKKKFYVSDTFMKYHKNYYKKDKYSFEKTFNKKFRDDLINLVSTDQLEYCNIEGLSPIVTNETTSGLKEIIKMSDNQLPGESIVGGYESNTPNKISTTLWYKPLLIHAFQNGDNSLMDPLMNSVNNGMISPEDAYLILSMSLSMTESCLVISYNSEFYLNNLSQIEVEKISRIRKQCGMYSLADQIKRVKYLNNDGFHISKFACNLNNLSYLDVSRI